jgi:hypothetical protein
MPPHVSAPADLVLHGPRVLGFASSARIAARYGLDAVVVDELLLDYEANGWASHSSFAGASGWSLTDRGRVENERRLRVELDHAGARPAVTEAHAAFIPLNRRFGTACTDWQIRPTRAEPLAANDHTDWTWDERVLRTLAALDKAFRQLCTQLAEHLQRFDGYADRYSSALAKVDGGQRRWLDGPDLDSCHTGWIQFHEDLLATLGIPRGTDT